MRDTTVGVFKEEAVIPWLGVAIILISFLEMYAFPKKMKYVHYAIKSHGGEAPMGFMLWMFHAMISLILMMMTYSAFGSHISPDESGESQMSPWMGAVFFMTVIKELYLLFCMMGMNDGLPPDEYARPNKREWVLDLILMAYACIVYSVTWETISYGMDMEQHDTPMFILNLVISSMLFLMFYMPLRIPYYLEELAHLETDKDFLLFIGSVLLVLIPAIRALC
jgi:hypothetical protein